MILSPDDLRAIDAAVRSVADRLQPEDRFDLRQELALRFTDLKERPRHVSAWLKNFAREWAARFIGAQVREREALYELHAGFPVPQWRRNENWSPTWYPPHPDAKEHAPFALKSARVMTCKPGMRGKSDG